MRPTLFTIPLLVAASLVLADDPAWKNKPMAQWDNKDAEEVLSYSPWAGRVTPEFVRDLSPDERRQGGDMQADQGKGVGLDGLIGIFDSARYEAAIRKAHEKPDPGTFMVRWESAETVRKAEEKSPDPEVPAIDTNEFYAIAVYNFPMPKGWSEGTLRGVAAIHRYQKKDLKPARVILQRKGENANIVYLFSRSAEITKKDVNIIFQAQIGRLVVTRIFSTDEMQLQGQLEL
jgi:hypothetical protein